MVMLLTKEPIRNIVDKIKIIYLHLRPWSANSEFGYIIENSLTMRSRAPPQSYSNIYSHFIQVSPKEVTDVFPTYGSPIL